MSIIQEALKKVQTDAQNRVQKEKPAEIPPVEAVIRPDGTDTTADTEKTTDIKAPSKAFTYFVVLAALLALDEARVNVKAKTMEGLGRIGEREAIAAHAVVLLEEK